MREPVFDPSEAGHDRVEAFERWRLVAVLRVGEQLDDVGVLEDGSGIRGTRSVAQALGELEQVTPVAFAAQPVVEVQAQVLLQVPAELGPVPSDEVYEAGVPPGTSLAPRPRKWSVTRSCKPTSSISLSG